MADKEKEGESQSSSSSSAGDKQVKTMEEKPLLSDTGTDVDKELSATVNQNENKVKNNEDSKVETANDDDGKEDTKANDKDETPTAKDSNGTTEDAKDEKPDGKEKDEPATKSATSDNKDDDLMIKSGRDLDGELIKREYVPTPRPRLLATPTPFNEPPRGAKFYKEVSRQAILEIEYEDPFETIKLFNLIGVEKRPVTLKDVPAEYRPYDGCIFDVLSSPDNVQRLADFTKFFSELATEGHRSRTCGLMYDIMHVWRTIYRMAMSVPPNPNDQATYYFFVKAGMYTSLLRILGYCLDREFLAIEYNRYVPYRIFELFFAASQSELDGHSYMVEKIIEETDKVLPIFMTIATGGISCLEELACCQVVGNMSCFYPGCMWLVDHPELTGIVGKHLWTSYDVMYVRFRQCEDRRIEYHKHLSYTNIRVGKAKDEDSEYKPSPVRIADLTTFVALCCLVNVCAAHPDETTMDKIEPSLLEVVKHGLYWNMGDVAYGILLNDSKYTTDLTIDKFLSFLSWSCFQSESQRIVMEQIKSLPYGQQDGPLLYFSRTSMSRSRTVVAFLITHALWLDYDRGSHYSILGLISLLQENVEYAMEVIEMVGDLLFDLGHSFHHVRMPCDNNPLSVKRFIFETFLRFGGYTYFDEKGFPSDVFHTQFDKDKHPQCLKDVRVFTERYIKEIQMEKREKETLVRAADAFKSEGNKFFTKGQLESAIMCYTKALETCPLSCTERRVTYHSNRAECYLKTNKLCQAIRDCNKALAMNPRNLKARWRRAQAFENLNKDYPAALDLLTIRQREAEAKQLLGEKLYWDLDEKIFKLMDGGTFVELTSKKNGPTIYQGMITREFATCVDGVSDKSTLPAFRGQHYHDIFGLGKGKYSD